MTSSARGPRDESEFDDFKNDIDAAERKVAGEIDPGPRALVVAILVFVLLVSFILPHTGAARGFDALVGGPVAVQEGISLPSRVFAWLALVFGVGFSMLALLTRRWVLAWVALAGTAVAAVLGMLAIWSRQTAPGGNPGPAVGLIIAWITVILLTFHWIRVVWARTAVQLAAEEARRSAVAKQQSVSLLDTFDSPGTDTPDEPRRRDGPDAAGPADKP